MTRKEIVKALRECSSGSMNCSKCPMRDSKIDLRCMDYAMMCAADMLEQDAPGWISVEDRLPEDSESVLAYFPAMCESEAAVQISIGKRNRYTT